MLEFFNNLNAGAMEECIASSIAPVKEIMNSFEEMIESGRGFPDILYPYTVVLYNSGKKEDASENLKRLLALNNRYSKYLELADYVLYGKEDSTDMFRIVPSIGGHGVKLEEMRKLVNVGKTGRVYSEYYSIIGDFYLKNMDYEKAFLFFCVSYCYGKPVDEFLFGLGSVAYSQGMTEEAGRMFREALEFEPDNMKVCLELSHVEAELGNDESSFRLLNLVHNKHPDWPDVSFRMAEYYLSRNERGKTESFLRNSLKYNPVYFSANILLFKLLVEKGDAQEIEAYLKEIPDRNLREKFEFLYAISRSEEYHRLKKLMLRTENISEEIIEGLWDDILGSVDKKFLAGYMEYLYKEDVISMKEMQDGIKRLSFNHDDI